MSTKLIKQFFSFSLGGYISLLIGFVSLPFVTRLISPEQYGVFSLFSLILNLQLIFLLMGLDQGFVRYFYEVENKMKLLFRCIKYPIYLFILTLPLVIIFQKKISLYIFQKIDIKMLIILEVTILLTILNNFTLLTIRMSQKGLQYSLLQIFNQLFNFLFIIVFYKVLGDSYDVLIISYFLSLVLVVLTSLYFIRNTFKTQIEENKEINTKELLKYSYPFVLTFSLTWIFQSSDKIAIKIFSNFTELGLYSTALIIIKLFNVIQSGFTTFWVPVAYEKYTKEPENKEFFNLFFNYISFIMFFVAIFVLMGKDLITFILGEKYKQASSIIPCLVFMPVMYTISETTVLGINFLKKTKFHIIISLVVSVFNIIGNMILVPRFNAVGAAISTGVAYILFFILRTNIAKKLIDYNFNLKRVYTISILLFLYALFLSFYNNILYSILIGILLLLILIVLYIKEIKIAIKEINSFIKKININKNS